ncbi:serine protease [Prauserella marina]|uniref:Serpin B n=1 Tax=Prauserella marina TaxID=530584 RepID=A0A222VMP7_9PSEU|nr:serpin family protein [Prauserella marina]ASR35198.1 serine protease [Prauserella marina]PWV85035.1 serpin B [Prauserella marina]SDC06310.1 serpin B [Prauserella marina]
MPSSTSEKAHLRFALSLHRAIAAGESNACWSPYSVASALGLVATAGRGPTADEVAALLAGAPVDVSGQAELLSAAARLSARASSRGSEEPVLAVANTLWAWDQLTVKQGFRARLETWPGGGVASAPFVEEPEKARAAINADVAATTRGLIPELLPSGAVRANTAACLVNALYLKVAWATRFAEADTTGAAFHAPSGTRTVPTMRRTGKFGYAAARGWRIVTIPAEGGVEAVVLLPDDALPARESAVDEAELAELLAAPTSAEVALSLPRIALDLRADLREPLAGLGVSTMFGSEADFGPLTDDERMAVSDVLHQSVLRVEEGGIEGAAATAVTFRLTSMPAGKPVEVKVDRPFLLLVRDAETGALYFMARVVEP